MFIITHLQNKKHKFSNLKGAVEVTKMRIKEVEVPTHTTTETDL